MGDTLLGFPIVLNSRLHPGEIIFGTVEQIGDPNLVTKFTKGGIMGEDEPKLLAPPPFVIGPPGREVNYLNILLYALPGVGKTYLSGTAEDDDRTAPVLFIDFEGGTLSIADRGERLHVTRVTNFATDFAKIYEYLYQGKHPYKTVVIDSLTEVQKLSMYDIMNQLVAAKPDRDGDIPSMQEWGKNIEQIRKVVRYFRDLPMHVIFTCLEMEVKDEVSGSITVRPSLSGKLSSEVAGFVDIVGRLSAHPVAGPDNTTIVERRLLVQPTGKYVAKDRSGKLGVEIVNPTIPKILQLITGTANKEE